MIEIHLPFPPSVNGLFSGKTRRYPSKPYKRWRSAAGWALLQQRPQTAEGPVTIDIALTAPDKRPRDCSNYIKPLEDLLVTHRVLVDDNFKHVREVKAHWAEGSAAAGAVVRITPAA